MLVGRTLPFSLETLVAEEEEEEEAKLAGFTMTKAVDL
jgi:hypothetical protein